MRTLGLVRHGHGHGVVSANQEFRTGGLPALYFHFQPGDFLHYLTQRRATDGRTIH